MSYQRCFFAIPADVPFSEVLEVFSEWGSELAFENDYDGVYLAANTQEEAERDGLWILSLMACPAPYGRVSRDFFADRWNRGTLFIMVYDDLHGVFDWQQVGENGRGCITTVGPFVGTRKIDLTIDYPQKAFSNDQISQILEKSEEELSDAEAAAVMDYDDAISLGLRQYGAKTTRQNLIELLYVEKVWSLTDDCPTLVSLPDSAGAVVDHQLEAYEFSVMGLEPGYY